MLPSVVLFLTPSVHILHAIANERSLLDLILGENGILDYLTIIVQVVCNFKLDNDSQTKMATFICSELYCDELQQLTTQL